MRRRDRAGLTLAPLLLRLALAVVFLWAGLGKLVAEMEITPEQAVVLAAAGVDLPGQPEAPEPAEDRAPTLDKPLPPADEDASPPADPPADTEAAPPAGEPEPDTSDQPSDEQTPPSETADPEPVDDATQAEAGTTHSPRIVLARNQEQSGEPDAETDADDAQTPDDAGADPAAPTTVRRVNGLILLMHTRAEPGAADDGSTTPAVWPDVLASGSTPRYLAWAVCFTEIFAGFFLLIGLLTRLSALALTGVMAGALWLATIGAAIQSGDAVLGFLPNYSAWSHDWQSPLFQLVVFCSSLALVFLGAGAVSLDRAIFAPSHDEEDDWDESEAPPKSLRERHSFDRSP